MKKMFPYLGVLFLMIITVGSYQNCSKMNKSEKASKSSTEPGSPSDPLNPFSQAEASIQIIDAEIRADSNQVRVLGVCHLPDQKRGEISGKITKTSCSDCEPLSWSTECENDMFQFNENLSDQLSVTSEDDIYTASVVMSVIDTDTQNPESSVNHSLTASIEGYDPDDDNDNDGDGDDDDNDDDDDDDDNDDDDDDDDNDDDDDDDDNDGDGDDTIPDTFTLSIERACASTPPWYEPDENCEAANYNGQATTLCMESQYTYPWRVDLDHGGRAICAIAHSTSTHSDTDNNPLFIRQSLSSTIYMYCPRGYSMSSEVICRDYKNSNNKKLLDVSVPSCSATCTKDTEEPKPTPPDTFTLSINQACSLTTSWIKPTENCKETTLFEGSTRCSESLFTHPWQKYLDHGGRAVCQTHYKTANYHNDDNESLSQDQKVWVTIYMYCPAGYEHSSSNTNCRSIGSNKDTTSMTVSVPSCSANCTKKE